MKNLSLLLAAAVLGACAASRHEASPDAALNALVEEYFDRQLELSPMNATAIGDSRFDDRLDESTSPGFREKVARHRTRLPRSRARSSTRRSFRRQRASPTKSSSANASSRSRASTFPRNYLPFNQMSGLPMDLAVYGSGSGPQPFATRARLRPLPQARAPVSALGRRRHRADARRHVARHHAAAARRWPRWCRSCASIVTPTAEASIFWGPIAAHAEAISPPPSAARITRRVSPPRSRTEVLPAYARLADFIERDYLPAARTTVGWTDLPDGAGLVPLAHPRLDHHGHAAGADPRARPATRSRASAARCSR